MQTLLDIVLWMQGKTLLPVLAMFLLLLASLYWPGRKAKVERNAMIPLDDDR